MRTIYFDCFSGVSGDMLLGALVDAGLDPEALSRELGKLGLDGWRLETSRVERSALAATKVDVVVGGMVEGPHGRVHEHGRAHRHGDDEPGGRARHGAQGDHVHRHHGGEAHGHGAHAHGEHGEHGADGPQGGPSRNLVEILELVRASSLSELTKERATRAFARLGEAEARAHGTSPERVHFHEVGAVDAIVDVVGAFAGFELLGVERFLSSAVNVGSGTVSFSHGTYPVPGPATAELLRGVPIYAGAVPKELATPTGAAVLTTVVESFGPLPQIAVERIGYGAGSRDFAGHPNVLRVMIGETGGAAPAGRGDRVVVVEAAVDDMTPEALGHFVERALAEGALDVYLAPVQMKKNRPGVAVTLLAEPADLDRMARLVFAETTTIGLRHAEVARRVLDRESVEVETEFGRVRVKVARLDGRVVNAAPEFEDCREAAARAGVPLRRVQAAAAAAFERRGAGGGE